MEDSEKSKNKAIVKFIADNLPSVLPNESKELIIRLGDAADIDPPVRVEITGTLNAPHLFYTNRKDLHDKLKCHVVYSFDKMKVELFMDEQYKYGHHITGLLTKNPDLDVFKINTSHKYTAKTLLEVIRVNRYFFPDKDKFVELVGSLQDFRATVQKDHVDSNAHKGESEKSVKSKVTMKALQNFKLLIPIHKGTDPKSFFVEVMVDESDGGVQMWLESPELRELEMNDRDELIKAAIAPFTAAGVVCLEQ